MWLFVFSLVGVILAFYYLKRFIDQYQETNKKKAKEKYIVESYQGKISAFFSDVAQLRKEYVANSNAVQLKEKYLHLYQTLTTDVFLDSPSLPSEFKEFIAIYENIDKRIVVWNSGYVKEQLHEHKDFFSNIIAGKSLDTQQRTAIVTDEDNNLVIAGAGSGKTLTIAGKVAYLVHRKNVKPGEILLIAFTKKAAEEMVDRIIGPLGIPVHVNTFHALGNRILTEANGVKSSIEDNAQGIIASYFDSQVAKDATLMELLVTFFGQYIYEQLDRDDYDNLGEYIDANKSIELQTLRQNSSTADKTTYSGEKVKSIEELLIANYLFLHGINYEYEENYEFDTADKQYRQYRPDFYLPDFDLYLEHFGISKDNRTPWLSLQNEKKYLDGMEWKRSIHKQNGTKLIETYSYEFAEGTIFVKLNEKLREHGLEIQRIDSDALRKCFQDIQSRQSYKELVGLFGTFLNLFKANGYTIDNLRTLYSSLEKSNPYSLERRKIFLHIFSHLYKHYENHLIENKRIDFNDMINAATEMIASNKIKLSYKYILIDEYQDISVSRFNLVKAIKNQTSAKVMAVGDDWQSIFRFTGSDLNLFTSFESKMGKTEIMKLESTYRNSQELIDIASSFVKRNPVQIPKYLRSNKHFDKPISVVQYNSDFKKALVKVLEKFNDGNQDKKIVLLGRNNRDIDRVINESSSFKLLDANKNSIQCTWYPNMKIEFLTVHKSKGLEADEVVIINCDNYLLGFPNQIADDPILNLVLNDGETFKYGEERRLLYVAMTRTKNRCVFLSPAENKQSVFVKELIKENNIPVEIFETDNASEYGCPVCKTGKLVERQSEGMEKSFYGCSNYPHCQFIIPYSETLLTCKKCGSFMVKRKGPRGEFWGCANYPACKATIEIAAT